MAAAAKPERRASKRIKLGLACRYEIKESADKEGFTFHEGGGTVLNMSREGMMLLLGIQPRIRQMIHVHLSHPRTDHTLSQVQVVWTRPAEEMRKYLANCKLLSGPYSPSQNRICAPTDFVSP